MSARNARFVERVRCEREALASVNSIIDTPEPLTALSGPAITRWRVAAKKIGRWTNLDVVSEVLGELSLRLDIQANNSREVFDTPRPAIDINPLLDHLRATCLECKRL